MNCNSYSGDVLSINSVTGCLHPSIQNSAIRHTSSGKSTYPLPSDERCGRNNEAQSVKGNDDTEYKRKLFELFTRYADVTASIGQLALEDQDEPMRFRMVMEKDWKEALVDEGIR